MSAAIAPAPADARVALDGRVLAVANPGADIPENVVDLTRADATRVLLARSAPGGVIALDLTTPDATTLERIAGTRYDAVVLPWSSYLHHAGHNLVALLGGLAPRLVVVGADRVARTYEGTHLSRTRYNTSYLVNLGRFAPSLAGRTVLEVGCADGLVCDMLLNEAPSRVVGIDLGPDPGSRFRRPRISYYRMDGAALEFRDGVFDVTLSIATLEHCPRPLEVIREMIRVTRPGGVCYCQAGPLYHSPFGHHMFGFFDALPWVHLRMDKPRIADWARANGVDAAIRAARGMEVEDYLDGMLNDRHLNGLRLSEYRLEQIESWPQVEVLFFNRSYEGRDLLTREIEDEIGGASSDELVAHGFELALRRR